MLSNHQVVGHMPPGPTYDLYLIWRELGMGFSRPEWQSHEGGKKNFHMNGLAGIVKEYFPMSGEAANGEILFLFQLLHSVP